MPILQQLFSGNETQIQDFVLQDRVQLHSTFIVVVLAVCLVFVSLARLRQREIFTLLGKSTLLFQSQEDQLKEGSKVTVTNTILLVLQFILVSAVILFAKLDGQTNMPVWGKEMLVVFLPGAYLIYQLSIALLTGRIIGLRQITTETVHATITTAQFFGVVMLVEFILVYFQGNAFFDFGWIILITYIVQLVLRFLRCFWVAIASGVKWYYIILYFWTLEILPLLLVFKLLYNEEFRTWIG